MVEVVAGVIENGEKVLIARRASQKSMAGKWVIPGGKIKKNEDPKKALERKLFEEFGIKTKTGNYINTNEHKYKGFSIRLVSYFTEHLSGEYNTKDHD